MYEFDYCAWNIKEIALNAFSSSLTEYITFSSLMGSGRMFHRLTQSSAVSGHYLRSWNMSPTMGSLRKFFKVKGRIVRLYRPSEFSYKSLSLIFFSSSLTPFNMKELTVLSNRTFFCSPIRVLSRCIYQRRRLAFSIMMTASISIVKRLLYA